MSCNTCQAKFSFFTKENGCPNCRFSYCSKCLKYKYNLPNTGVQKICGPCFNKLQRQEDNAVSTNFNIPAGLDEPLTAVDITKRIESLEDPSKPPIVMYKQKTKLDTLGAVLDPVDQEIVNRLKKLKNEDKQLPPPTENEIRRRLALLKDQDPDVENQSINMLDVRTKEQTSDDLINEYLSRLEISKAADATDSEIRARLDNLRGIDSSKYTDEPMQENSDDEETATQKLIEKALAEAYLEDKYDESIDEPKIENSSANIDRPSDEFEDIDCCVMCDKTQNLVICKGCTGDLYCPACFEENHDDFEMHKHSTVPFKSYRQ